uniref:Uncharacterized protein n=1 Tax=Pseudomonas aeruginosa TaxID=287 RepID=A0A2L1KIA7_PSEAI|nr:Hypothetical protein [Pseudomonas aeruginosa]QNI17065.1 Hypothetical protein [Pseudomonas sp.]WMM94665.1 hypothetical protein [Pseudomonas kurunegalensis]AVE21576.1 Hypothetical protein [Pseudomonas aeruginosa]AVE22064.1 Hypothetical protein [Pseudomonas aeruginosa]
MAGAKLNRWPGSALSEQSQESCIRRPDSGSITGELLVIDGAIV